MIWWCSAVASVLAVVVAGGCRPAPPPATPATPLPDEQAVSPAAVAPPTADFSVCGPDSGDPSGWLTVPFAPTDGCPGGRIFIDGVDAGSFPTRRQPVSHGVHRVELQSADDCAGMRTETVTIEPGCELVFHTAGPSPRRRLDQRAESKREPPREEGPAAVPCRSDDDCTHLDVGPDGGAFVVHVCEGGACMRIEGYEQFD